MDLVSSRLLLYSRFAFVPSAPPRSAASPSFPDTLLFLQFSVSRLVLWCWCGGSYVDCLLDLDEEDAMEVRKRDELCEGGREETQV